MADKPLPKITDVEDLMRQLSLEDQQRLTLDMYQRIKIEKKQRKANIYKNFEKFNFIYYI